MITTWVQQLSNLNAPLFDALFLGITFLSEDIFILILVFVVYWCINKRHGETLLVITLGALVFNSIIKDIVRRPRPFLNENFSAHSVTSATALVDTQSLAHSYSMPSLHSQLSSGVYLSLALWIRSRWYWVLSILIVLGIMISRIYLGLHYAADVLVGAALGVVIALFCRWLMTRFYKQRLLLFGVVALLSISTLMIAPSADTCKTIGAALGSVLGIWFEMQYVNFSTDVSTVSTKCRFLRLLFGVVTLLLSYIGLKLALPTTLLFWGVALFYPRSTVHSHHPMGIYTL